MHSEIAFKPHNWNSYALKLIEVHEQMHISCLNSFFSRFSSNIFDFEDEAIILNCSFLMIDININDYKYNIKAMVLKQMCTIADQYRKHYIIIRKKSAMDHIGFY